MADEEDKAGEPDHAAGATSGPPAGADGNTDTADPSGARAPQSTDSANSNPAPDKKGFHIPNPFKRKKNSPAADVATVEMQLKRLAIVISMVALVPSCLSGATAVLSYLTARAALEQSRLAQASSGAALETSDQVQVRGSCDNAADPLAMIVTVYNWGHLPGKILDVELYSYSTKPAAPSPTTAETLATLGNPSGLVVDAQGSQKISLTLNCEQLRKLGVVTTPADTSNLLTAMTGRVNGGYVNDGSSRDPSDPVTTTFRWLIHPTYAFSSAPTDRNVVSIHLATRVT